MCLYYFYNQFIYQIWGQFTKKMNVKIGYYIFYLILLCLIKYTVPGASSGMILDNHWFNVVENRNLTACQILLDKFAGSSANFTQCIVMNARPVTICEGCVDFYIKVLSDYNNLMKLSDDGGSCRDRFLHLDRLEVVEASFVYSSGFWDRAACGHCFMWENNALTNKLANETIIYRELFNKTITCIKEHLVSNNKTLCEDCMQSYLALNDFYDKKLKHKHKETSVCMDIVDAMNATRRLWSGDLNCCKLRQHPEIIFLGTACFVILLPIFFYILTKAFSNKKEAAVLLQNRFSESFPTPSTSRSTN